MKRGTKSYPQLFLYSAPHPSLHLDLLPAQTPRVLERELKLLRFSKKYEKSCFDDVTNSTRENYLCFFEPKLRHVISANRFSRDEISCIKFFCEDYCDTVHDFFSSCYYLSLRFIFLLFCSCSCCFILVFLV